MKNEKYIGHVTDSLLNSNDSNEDFNEEALAVKMLKVKNPSNQVTFAATITNIERKIFSDLKYILFKSDIIKTKQIFLASSLLF